MSSKIQPVDFSGLIVGFCSAALHYLGEGEEKKECNTDLALQNIQIIEMLKQKTEGNRTGDETQLIDSVIRDLRAKYQDHQH